MQWSDRGIVLSVRRLGENSAVIHVLTLEHGLHAGVDKGAFGKRKRGIYQPGNIVNVQWQARLSEHLGMFVCEMLEPCAAFILDSRHKLAALNSATALVEKMLSERDEQRAAYDHMEVFIHALIEGDEWLAAYVRLEFTLLACSGFGLDLERCASTGQVHDLTHVSPKSGRAVSAGAAAPYGNRLFKLPAFLLESAENTVPDHAQILDGVRLCGYFLEERVFAPRGYAMPAARARFVEHIEKSMEIG